MKVSCGQHVRKCRMPVPLPGPEQLAEKKTEEGLSGTACNTDRIFRNRSATGQKNFLFITTTAHMIRSCRKPAQCPDTAIRSAAGKESLPFPSYTDTEHIPRHCRSPCQTVMPPCVTRNCIFPVCIYAGDRLQPAVRSADGKTGDSRSPPCPDFRISCHTRQATRRPATACPGNLS